MNALPTSIGLAIAEGIGLVVVIAAAWVAVRVANREHAAEQAVFVTVSYPPPAELAESQRRHPTAVGRPVVPQPPAGPGPRSAFACPWLACSAVFADPRARMEHAATHQRTEVSG